MAEFIDDVQQPARNQGPTLAEVMAAHGSGSAHAPLGCDGTARCEPWKAARMRDIMEPFWANPIVRRTLAEAGHANPTAAVVDRAL